MTSIPVTPWTARFLPLLDKAEISRKVMRRSTGLSGLEALPAETACELLKDELERVFYPTAQMVDVLHQQIGIALGHSLLTYSDSRSYIHGIYDKEDAPLKKSIVLRCLTGLAGIGKSKLVEALGRLLSPLESRAVASNEQPSPAEALWVMNVKIRSSLSELFSAYGGTDGNIGDKITTMRKRAFRDGVSLVIADEFQFQTSSSSAHTRTAQTLLSLGYCGIPTYFVANYSLLHRLLRRSQEDHDRLLCYPTILTPDLPDSEDWAQTVTFLIETAQDVFRIDPRKDGAHIHRMCAGLKRVLADLLVIAYRGVRERVRPGERATVSLKDLQTAYETAQFASHRMNVEIIIQQTILNRIVDRRKTDLWCPLEASEAAHSELRKAVIRQRDVALAQRIQEAAASRSERELATNLVQAPASEQSGQVVKLPRSQRPSSVELQENARRLLDY